MIDKPKFKDCYQVEVLESDYVFLLREGTYKVLSGPKYRALAPLLNGQNTVVELSEQLEGTLSLPVIQYMLNQLEAQGCIVDAAAGNGSSPQEKAYFYALGHDADASIRQLHTAQVALTAVGEVDIELLRAALEQQGISVGDGDATVSTDALQVVVVDDYAQDALEAVNHRMLASGQAWLLVKLVGTKSWIGPIFQPHETACWQCLTHRLRTNRQVEMYILRKHPRNGPLITSRSALPTTIKAAANIAAVEIVKWIVQGKNDRLRNNLITFDHLTLEMENHAVTHRPQCAACGDPILEGRPRPFTFSEKADAPIGSSFRSQRAEDTFKTLEPLISPISGVITHLGTSSREQNGLTFTRPAGHYFPLITDTVYWLRQNLKSHTGGKGATDIQAKVSAVCEAIERYSTIYWGKETTTRASYRSLEGCAIHPQAYLGYSQHQYESRAQWNQEINSSSYQIIPVAFDETQPVDWVPVWSMRDEEFKYVLATYCYYGHPDSRYFFNTIDSNGVAAGSSIEEALLQGFAELVERDSVAIWWYNQIRRPGVDLESFNLPYLSAIRDYYRTIYRELWVLDITTDLNIPAFAALSRRTDSPIEDVIYGFGAHLDPQTAIMQAVTEMNQCLSGVRRLPDGSTDYRWAQKDAVDWWKHATLANSPYLVPDSAAPAKTLADYPHLTKATLRENVDQCVEIARQAGLDMLALDLTRADIGMNVCRVMVPGLRHFWRRLGPGRLYEVPVQLGWLSQPTAEEAMNPFSIFF